MLYTVKIVFFAVNENVDRESFVVNLQNVRLQK